MEKKGGAGAVTDESLGRIFARLDRAADRKAVSQVCRQWRTVDANTRKYVEVANCYSVAPSALSGRFPNLEGLKVKGKPRAFDFELLVPNWGGYALPWVSEICRAYTQRFHHLHFRRMHVTEEDLILLAESLSESLYTLKLDKCSGVSSLGLCAIAARCRSLKVLFLEESEITDKGGNWLNELARNNSSLEELNFTMTGAEDVDAADLETIVDNCKFMRSLKVSEIELTSIRGVLTKASILKELGTGCCSNIGEPQNCGNSENPGELTVAEAFYFPRGVVSLSGLESLTDAGLTMISGLLPNLTKLDLKYVLLSVEGYCQLLRNCGNLEVLEVRNVLGDEGLEVVGQTCKHLRRLRVERDDLGFVTSRGIIPLVQGCIKLEYLVMYVSDINNKALKTVGEYCTNLNDCRFVIVETPEAMSDFPLDEGVRYLLRGCVKLTRFALYVRHGGLTDKGMSYIGAFGGNLKWILLGCAGESDVGLAHLGHGCQSLERLEMRDCPVTEHGLATVTLIRPSLKYLWVQAYRATEYGGKVLRMVRPCFWIVEVLNRGSAESPGQLLAYSSLAGPRTDIPAEVELVSLISKSGS